MAEKEVNNPEVAPAIEDGQVETDPNLEGGQGGEGTDSQITEQPDEGSEAGSGEEDKGLPDDPKELRKLMTQKTQQYAEEKKEWEKNTAELENWRKLKADKDFLEFVKKKTEGGKKEVTVDDLKQMAPEQQVRYFIDQAKSELKGEFEAKYDPVISDVQTKAANAVIAEFFSKNPTAESHRAEIAKVMKTYPGIPMDAAWKIINSDNAPAEATKKALADLELKKKANLEMPGNQPSSLKRPKKVSPEQAVDLAFKDLEV